MQVTNSFGSADSNAARVTVSVPPGRPIIVRHPAGCFVPHLGSFGLSVLAEGERKKDGTKERGRN